MDFEPESCYCYHDDGEQEEEGEAASDVEYQLREREQTWDGRERGEVM